MNKLPLFVQINLHPNFGGGEVFAAHLAGAAADLGSGSMLVVHPATKYWADMALPNTRLIRARDWEHAASVLPKDIPVIVHAPPPEAVARDIAATRALIGFVHMPLNKFYAQTRHAYAICTQIVGVSNYVLDTVRALGMQPWPEPFYGVASLHRTVSDQSIVAASEFEWDRRKVRDRLLGLTEPLWSRLRARPSYRKRGGLTLGIVSRIAPIKQFPLLFSSIMPALSAHKEINIEIFGSGGYASVRDLRVQLRPLASRVRFWGHQRNVAQAYAGIDVMLTGLPEREALGLNVIEAQACGVPVLAPGEPPFTETIVQGQTGWLYADPRKPLAEGQHPSFAETLEHILSIHQSPAWPDPRRAVEHMKRFSRQAFAARLAALLAASSAK